ncbi:MAG TPA: LPS assembly lipoprotein LptE [Phycisphaerae bacterium]|nr:LPS assembly lipoprotein LptE [Phycisphaerae bacterium]HRY67218.1 LPS assembly lipoprotein LptE [Phycisphaerae bacterium]HSA26412.1 LPS assembly lipoprotein LptE [Phycisphaerae bacterium]
MMRLVDRREKPARAPRSLFLGPWLPMAGLALMMAGCGYSSDSLYRKNIRTVYVEMFQTKEFRRGIEFQLTEAVRKEIDRRTPYKNAPKEKADSVMSGEVLEWQETAIGHDHIAALPRDTAGTLVIRFRWQDMRTGKIIVEHPRLITTIQYVRPAGETIEQGRFDAVTKMARAVVDRMATDW